MIPAWSILSTKLVRYRIMNTCTKIKLDNRTIAKIRVEDLDFSYINKVGETKFKDRLYLPFQVAPKSLLKGLKCFMGTTIDIIVIENCLLRKEKQNKSLKIDYKDKYRID